MLREMLWPVGFGLLLTGLVVPLMRRRPVIVPLVLPMAFLMCEICIFEWLWFGGWTKSVYLIWLLGFVFVGCVLLYQHFGRRRWFVFRGGGFYRDMDTYAALAQAVRETLQLEGLPPATVVLRYDGWVGLAPLTDYQESVLCDHLNDCLEDTKWQRWGWWQLFFGVQWAVIGLMLINHAINMSGGM